MERAEKTFANGESRLASKATRDGMTVDPESNRPIRLTDNSLKEGDFQAPQDNVPLELDENGLPAYVYGDIGEVR